MITEIVCINLFAKICIEFVKVNNSMYRSRCLNNKNAQSMHVCMDTDMWAMNAICISINTILSDSSTGISVKTFVVMGKKWIPKSVIGSHQVSTDRE